MVKIPTQNYRKLTETIHRLELEKVQAIVRKQGKSRLDEPAVHDWKINDQVFLRSEGFRVPVSNDLTERRPEYFWHDDRKKWKVRALDSLEETWVSPCPLSTPTSSAVAKNT